MSLRPIKRLGQHFLVDPNTIRRIIAQLEAPPDGLVVEIGPGTGALTKYLVAQYADYVAIEIDDRAVELLRETYPGIHVRHMDILDIDYGDIARGNIAGGDIGGGNIGGGDIGGGNIARGNIAGVGDSESRSQWVIGNLPYNITSQILFGLLDAPSISRAVLTMQKEVAERLVAQPRTKAYGILSVLVQLYARPKVCFHLSPNVFRPKPEVWSSTVRLDFPPLSPLGIDVDRNHLRLVVRAAFNQRRKTLRNSLREVAANADIEIPDQWAGKRAEELAPSDFVELARSLSNER